MIYYINTAQEIELYKIGHIIEDTNTIMMFAQNLLIKKFDNHYQCYLVELRSDVYKMFNFENLEFFPECIHVLATGELAVRPPEKNVEI